MSLPRPTPVSEPVAEGLTVFVRGLEVEAAIGVHDHELGRTQPLVLDVELQLAPRSVRRLEDTYNYEGVGEAARALLAEGHIGLVETFAERLALALLADQRLPDRAGPLTVRRLRARRRAVILTTDSKDPRWPNPAIPTRPTISTT